MYEYKKGKYEATFESLYTHDYPEWFRDAKFGIWSHWGPQSVPMYGDWYARKMYQEDDDSYRYHIRKYGHPSKFGYKDIVKLWKAENFDPDELMSLYVKAGARYFMGQAVHCDNFYNYASKVNRFNSVNMGPGKDISKMWQDAAHKHNIPFGLSEHNGIAHYWFGSNKLADTRGKYAGVPYDGNDPEYRDFYLDNYDVPKEAHYPQWYWPNAKFYKYWYESVKEMIDLYNPDLLYTDGGLPFAEYQAAATSDELYAAGLSAVAHLYNSSIEKHGYLRSVYLQKDRRPEIYKVGILDIEKSQLPEMDDLPWHTDTCIGDWFYDVRRPYKSAKQIIEMLVDIVSKNGAMLLNILQKPDGTIDEEARFLLEEVADWFAACGEGIHGSRPWRTYREGASEVLIDGFREETVEWTPSDFRFTKKGNVVYAYMLAVPENRIAVIKSFTEKEIVKKVRLLGHGEVAFSQQFGAVSVRLPDNMPAKTANCLAIEL